MENLHLDRSRPRCRSIESLVKPSWGPMDFVLQKKNLTPQKTNMEPKNEALDDDFPLQTGDFQVLC